MAEWGKIIQDISSHAKFVKITGGEPTLSPNFKAIIELLDQHGISFAVLTNGRWQSPKKLIELLGSKKNFRGMLVSLHGTTTSIHSAFVGTESFDETCANIEYASRYINVATNTVITGHNYQTMPGIVRFSQKLGAKSASFSRYIGASIDGITPSYEELQLALQDLERLKANGAKIKYGPCIPQCFEPSSAAGCSAGISFCSIDPWGNVRACNHSTEIAGSLKEQSIHNIWHGKSMKSWRNLIPIECVSCQALDYCAGGCKAQMMQLGMSKDPLMTLPLMTQPPPKHLKLPKKGRPFLTSNIVLDTNTGEYSLISRAKQEFITKEAKEMLENLNGQYTLEEINTNSGLETINLIGSLWQKGFIEIHNLHQTNI